MVCGLVRRLNRLSIKGYVIFWVACVFVACAAVAAGWWRTELLHNMMTRRIQFDAEALDAGRQFKSALQGEAYADMLWQTTGDSTFREESQEDLHRAEEIVGTLSMYRQTANNLRVAGEIRNRLKAFRLEIGLTPEPTEDELRSVATELLKAAEEYIALQRNDLSHTYEVARALQGAEERWWIALMLLTGALLAAGSLGLLVRVVRPIGEMTRTAERFGAGDYSARGEVAHDDELGALCRTLNGLGDNVVSYMAEQRRTQEELRSLALFPDENPDPVIRSSREGAVLYANKPAVEFLNGWDSATRAAIPAPLREEVEKTLSAGAAREGKIRCGDRVFQFMLAPVADRGYVNLYGRDVTEHDRLEAALAHSRDELEQRVQERTAELVAANKALQAEVAARGRMESALRESRERFRLVMENSPDTVSILDRDLVFRWMLNPFPPHTPEEFIGKPLGSFTAAPEDTERRVRLARGVLETGQPVPFESRSLIVGVVRHLEITFQPWRDAGGKIIGVASYAHDITERKRAEEALRESEARFRSTFNDAPIGMTVVSAEGRILQANRAHCEFLGYSERKLTGMNILDVTHPDDREETSRLSGAMREGGPRIERHEKRYVRKDGEEVWAEVSVSMIRDADGKPDYSIAQIVDITERKRAEQALRESEQRYRELFESSPIGLVEEDWASVRERAEQARADGAADVRAWFLSHPEEALLCFGRIQRLDVNRATVRLFKAADKEELLAKFGRLPCAETRATVIRAIAGMAAGDEFFEAETAFQTLTGEERRLLVNISRAPAAGKSLPRYIVSLSDVTDLRRAQQEVVAQRQAAQLQRMELLAVTGRLAAGVAHEINNPLQGIMAQLRLLSDELPERLRQGRRIQLIQGGIDRIAGIVRNLLQLHRAPPAGEESCAVSPVISVLADMISSMTASQHIRLEVAVSPPEMTIPMSANALAQVLLNLALNAIDAMPEGGVMRIEATRDREASIVSVSDTGAGISVEHRARLFSPFFTTKGPKGTGLGLSMTHSLVTSAGGAIAVNERAGGGTTFAIRFENTDAPV